MKDNYKRKLAKDWSNSMAKQFGLNSKTEEAIKVAIEKAYEEGQNILFDHIEDLRDL